MYLNDNMRIRVILTFFFFHSFVFSSKILQVDLITTNDLHGSISEQMAYFMNPQFPPTIIGGAGFYKYINDNEWVIFPWENINAAYKDRNLYYKSRS